MTIATNRSSRATRVSRVIEASPDALYAAFMDPDALTEWPIVMCTAMLAMLPPVAVVILMQRLFVRGLVETEK